MLLGLDESGIEDALSSKNTFCSSPHERIKHKINKWFINKQIGNTITSTSPDLCALLGIVEASVCDGGVATYGPG